MMQMIPYLSFRGQCEEAFAFYEQNLGGKLGALFRYAGSPMEAQVPPTWGNKVMHGSVSIGEQLLMGGDVAPDTYETPRGFSLSLQINDVDEAERIFHALSTNGRIVMPLQNTFWAPRFGVVVDQFGIQWLVNCE